MNGSKYLFDTNAIISFLKGNHVIDSVILQADWLATSVISFIEFLSFADLDETDKSLFYQFIDRINLAPLPTEDRKLLESIAEIRKITKVRLPDAIIAGTTIYHNAVLITNDKGFSSVPLLQMINF